MSGTGEAAKRTLEKNREGSNPESPQKKQAGAEEDAAVVPVDDAAVIEKSKVEKMFEIMMKKMGDVEAKMDGVTSKVDDAVKMSEEANEGVKKVKEEVKAVRDDIDKEKRERKEWQSFIEEKVAAAEYMDPATEVRPPDPIVQNKINEIEKKLANMKVLDPWASAAAANIGGKGNGKASKDPEKSSRTVCFGPFPQDSSAEEVKAFIDKVMTGVKDAVEETFPYGKKRAERGGARFKSKEDMWKYMTENKGRHQHQYEGKKGHAKIYCNVDSAEGGYKSGDPAMMKNRAMKKVVRTIIEANGGDGPSVKKTMDTSYPKGVVWWKDERVAEWTENEGTGYMKLLGYMLQHEATFKAFLKKE
jgi:hypothetical protein